MVITARHLMKPIDTHLVFSTAALEMRCFDYNGRMLWKCKVQKEPTAPLHRPVNCFNHTNVAILISDSDVPTPAVLLRPPSCVSADGKFIGDCDFYSKERSGAYGTGYRPSARYLLDASDMYWLEQMIRMQVSLAATVFCTVV